MKINNRIPPIRTHEGAVAKRITTEQELRRSVLSCMLWEKEFYESGKDITTRIADLACQVPALIVANLAVEARSSFNLRHVPLLLLLNLIERRYEHTAEVICDTIQRADELTELVAIYWKDGKKPFSKKMKQGLALAFGKFNEYQFAKYNRDGAVKLRDVMFLTHPKPIGKDRAEMYERIASNTLITPDTWEVALSSGADKKATFERLISEGQIGYLALLRNLRNMIQSGVNSNLVKSAILARKGADRVLPFRFVAAARAAPMYERELDAALLETINLTPPMTGKTVILVDVSGSMDSRLSEKSDMTRMDSAATLGSIISGDTRVFTFSNALVEVAPRLGMAGVDAIIHSQNHSGTELRGAVNYINTKIEHDRLIVITDEQASSSVPDPICDKAYMINVASARNGVGYGKWLHLDGFSENVIRYIKMCEQ